MKFVLAFALVVLTLGASALEAVAQEQQAVVRASAAAVERNGKEYVRVDVMVEDVEDLGGFAFVMSWDGHILEGDQADIQRGDFLGSSGRQVYCEAPVLERYALRYACVTLGSEPRAGASGSGLLASVYLTPDGNGNSSIQFSSAQLTTPPGETITTQWESGEIEVSSSGSATNFGLVLSIIGAGVALVAGLAAIAVFRRRRSLEPAGT